MRWTAAWTRCPEIARRYGITVSLGLYLTPDLEKNEKEIELGHPHRPGQPAHASIRVVVGNETQLFGLYRARRTARTPYHPPAGARRAAGAHQGHHRRALAHLAAWSRKSAKNVDVIFVHLLPYWENTHISYATPLRGQRIFATMPECSFPGKPIIIGEAGWPSEGNTKGRAVASTANEAYFVRAFVQHAMEKGYDYYIMEAYDQPWKDAAEGSVGRYWGLFDAGGRAKFAFTGLLRNFPEWRGYASLAAALTLALGLLVLGRMPRVRQTGYLVMGGLIALMSTGLLALIDATALEYIDPTDIAAMIAMSPLVLLACAIILTEGIELAASLWRVDRRVMHAPAIAVSSPKVSIHVPTYNEPPGMVIATLDALAGLDYENYEVIVLDNNTSDVLVWGPVEEHCRALGPRFRFFHFAHVPGFKAGALNLALTMTDPMASHVAVIDSDYQVMPFWLRRAMPFFASPKIAIVQGPQDYRDSKENIFKAMAYEEYRGFFHIGMVERNEHNAIIQHGTMTIVSKEVLQRVGGWAEWCITEDTELGLRIFEAGYEAAYIPQTMGAGLEPDTLEAFMSQRYRWVYGSTNADHETPRQADFSGERRADLGAALSVPLGLAAMDFRWSGHGGDADRDRVDHADVGDPHLCRCADAGSVGGGDGAVRHQDAQDAVALSAQSALRRQRCGHGCPGRAGAHSYGGQGDVGGTVHLRQAVPAHAQMHQPGPIQPGTAGGVAGNCAAGVAADRHAVDGLRSRLCRSGSKSVDGDAGGAEPALCAPPATLRSPPASARGRTRSRRRRRFPPRPSRC